MKKARHKNVSKILAEGKQVDEAIVRAAQAAVRRHIRAGNRVAVGRNGKTQLIEPQELKLKHQLAEEA